MNNKKHNYKRDYSDKLLSPFGGRNTVTIQFNEEEFRNSLNKIFPKEDNKLIDTIVNDKKIFNEILAQEKAIIRDKNLDWIEMLQKGDKTFVEIPKHIEKLGLKGKIKYISHNHTNGIVIPSPADIKHFSLLKSKINPIYSPNKNSIIINRMHGKKADVTSKDYTKKLNEINKKIENKYPKNVKKLEEKYSGNELVKRKEEDLYKPYYIENNEKIVDEINKMLKQKNYNIEIILL